MKAILLQFNNNSSDSLYVQLYKYLRNEIASGDIECGERLPSLRQLAAQLMISVTTCQAAYDQLLVEGYVESKPHSGYYVRSDFDPGSDAASNKRFIDPVHKNAVIGDSRPGNNSNGDYDSDSDSEIPTVCDPDTFDFIKWKKCFSHVINEKQNVLLTPADPQGEHALRRAISDYLYTARGVTAPPESIVIAAGIQQLTQHITRILDLMGINLINVEDPGYERVKNILKDRGMTLNEIRVSSDGIDIEKLPENIETAVYVSPSNQFPTGAIMPADRRYRLLEWAGANNSIVIEDDYDSELRYFGRPIPALKSIDAADLVVYLGSFSSTLFPSIKISYMALPKNMANIYAMHKGDYDQTCAKAEQLTLAEFMANGYYRVNIRKLRKLCSRKLDAITDAFKKQDGNITGASDPIIRPVPTNSGIQLHLNVDTKLSADELCSRAAMLGLRVIPVPHSSITGSVPVNNKIVSERTANIDKQKVSGGGAEDTEDKKLSGRNIKTVALYFDQIPLRNIDEIADKLHKSWDTRE